MRIARRWAYLGSLLTLLAVPALAGTVGKVGSGGAITPCTCSCVVCFNWQICLCLCPNEVQ
jgi:hypothetical protein